MSLADLGAAPNVVTILRIALVPVAIALLAAGRRPSAAAVLVLMVATDGLDGLLARRLGRVTALGKVLDPVADKVAIDSLLAFLSLSGEFPRWALAVIVLRDVAILAGALAIAKRTRSVPAAIAIGKVALVVLAAMTFVFVLDVRGLEMPFLAAGVACAVASGLAYAVSMRAALRSKVARP